MVFELPRYNGNLVNIVHNADTMLRCLLDVIEKLGILPLADVITTNGFYQ